MDALVLQSGKRIRRRVLACGVIFSLLLGVILARAVHWQLTEGKHLASRARNQYLREQEIQPRRGAIVDRRGQPLATSVDEESAYIVPAAIREAKKDAENIHKQYFFPEAELARALHMDLAEVHRLAQGESRQLLKRALSPAESAALHTQDLNRPGVELETKFRRFYPNTRLASHILGTVDFEGRGVEGVERSEDELLSGDAHAVRSVRDVRGNMLIDDAASREPPTGARVELTIDSAIQDATEKALSQQMASSRALAAFAVVMDPRTGAILALANAPDFNPNRPGDAEGMRNRAVTGSYEPGSVMKCFLVAGALSDGVVKPETMIDVSGGELHLGKRTIHDHDEHEPGHPNFEPVREVIAKSSNVGAARIGLKLGSERLLKWFKAFGFGERTNIELPAEAHGVLQSPDRMGDIATATTAFGQGMTASGVQVVTALSAIANGGKLMRPYIVRKIVPDDGDAPVERKPEIVRQVLTPQVARTMTDIMIGVTTPHGTGPKAAIDGMEVAGKTGTAQKVDPNTHTYGRKHFASFMGFAPADDPKVAIYVAFDAPEKDTFGGEVAAPAFKQIATVALLNLGVTPSMTLATVTRPPPTKPSVSRETEVLDDDTEAISVESSDEDQAEAVGEGATVVPDLKGCSARAGLRLLHDRSLDAELLGSGRVLSQHPEAGRHVPIGTRVRVALGAG